MRGLSYRLGLVAIFLCHVAAAQEDPAARVLTVSGKVAVTSNGKEHAAEVYGGLFRGDTLSFAPKSAIVLAWPATNRVERWTATGKEKVQTTVGAEGLSAAPDLKVVKFPRKLEPSLFEGLPPVSPGAVTIAHGAPDPPGPQVEPIPGSVILSDRPDFSWPAAADTDRYELRLRRGVDLVWKAETDATKHSVPSSKALIRGKPYTWEVVAVKSDATRTPLLKTTFTVADKEEVAEVETLKRLETSLKENDPDRVPMLVLIASRLETLVLVSDATRVYEQLARLTPKSAACHAALFELYQRAGRRADAAKSRRVAEELGFKFNEIPAPEASRDDE